MTARVLILALRVLVAVVSLQVSGTPAVAAELGLRLGDAVDDCCNDCPMEKDGKECPPGCPNCHCAHGIVALPTALESSAPPTVSVGCDVEPAPYEASVPRAPPLPGVYRPPRVISLSA